jgi:hypothetical protein
MTDHEAPIEPSVLSLSDRLLHASFGALLGSLIGVVLAAVFGGPWGVLVAVSGALAAVLCFFLGRDAWDLIIAVAHELARK